jgi:DinB superfamily
MDLEPLKYPIGKFEHREKYSASEIRANIKVLDKFPAKLKALTSKLTENQLDTPYRPEGWTVRQVVHHLADSHANMFLRTIWAITENNPTIKGYNEADWAKLPDHFMPIKPSLLIIEGLHKRMVFLLKSLDKKDLKKTYYHAGYQKSYEIQDVIALYAWHCNHHYAHILQALNN